MKWNPETIRALLDEMAGPSDPSDPRQRRRRRIITTAADLFVTQGYRKTSVDQIAERAGVAKGTVYLHVKSKVELLILAIVEEKRQFLTDAESIFAPDIPARKRLELWLDTAFVMCTRMPLISRLMSGDRELFAALYEYGRVSLGKDWLGMQMDFVSQMLDEAASPHTWTPLELGDRAKVLLGLLFFAGSLTDPNVRIGLSIERYAHLLVDMLVNGLCPSSTDTT